MTSRSYFAHLQLVLSIVSKMLDMNSHVPNMYEVDDDYSMARAGFYDGHQHCYLHRTIRGLSQIDADRRMLPVTSVLSQLSIDNWTKANYYQLEMVIVVHPLALVCFDLVSMCVYHRIDSMRTNCPYSIQMNVFVVEIDVDIAR
jgi:hypothetical protein